MPAMSVLIKPASSLCNMKCDYCFYHDEAVNRKEECHGVMKKDTLRNVMKKTMFRADGTITYAFQGGEPTLAGIDFFKDVVRFQQEYNRKELVVYNTIQTNGYSINEQWCQFFKENNFLVGVSLDGTKALHDAHRHDRNGNDTFDRILESIRLLEKYKVDFNILTVVHTKTVDHVKEIYDFYRKNGWKYMQFIPYMEPIGSEENQMLTAEEYGRFLIELFDLWYMDWKKNQGIYIRMFENLVGRIMGYEVESCDMKGECSIQYVIESDGSVYPCDFYALDEYLLGNLNSDSITAVDKKRLEISFVERSKTLKKECYSCRYFSLCRGGCYRYRIHDDNRLCEGYKAFFEHSLTRMEEIAKYVKEG